MIRFSRCSSRALLAILMLLGPGLAVSCNAHHVKVEPTRHTVEFKPIYLTVDVNIRVQKELDRFFEEVEKPKPEEQQPGGKS